MIDKLVLLSKKLELPSTEKLDILEFKKKQSLNNTLKVLKILKKYSLEPEHTELLRGCIQNFPHHHLFRIMLAETYYLRGLVPECLRLISRLPNSSSQNSTALGLLLKCSVILERHDLIQIALTKIKMEPFLDQNIYKLTDTYTHDGLNACKEQITKEFLQRGIVLPVQQKNSVISNFMDPSDLGLEEINPNQFKIVEISNIFTPHQMKSKESDLEYYANLIETLETYAP